ncbi:MAG: hypothetical protein QF805_26335 [Pirellulaceae bacterium]|jgi:hypothetical protein|nr:hypothetical protein [Pirellulaceae bacterium]
MNGDWIALGAWIAAPVLGLIGLLAARIWERTPRQTMGQSVFWLCLASVALVTISHLACSGDWVSGGLTFSLMAVGAAVDLDGTPKPDVNY